MKRIALFLLVLTLNTFRVSAQYFDIGQEPWHISWEQANTSNFQVIYPDYYRSTANKTALLLERWRLPVSRSLKVMPPRTPVILHTGSAYSNAFTIWAPRRLEFLTIPPQDIYGQSWLEQLVIHEYRHMAQISSVNRGFTKTLGVIFGQQAAPAILGLFVPPWFMEGDAVATETALSHSGRGRLADFSMPLKAQLLDKGPYHYTKATLGSYKDFVPDEYIIGYHLVSTGRYKYGIGLWNSALERTGSKPYTLNPFSKGISLVAGKKKRLLYDESMSFLDSLWKKPVRNNYRTMDWELSDDYTNYTHPFRFHDKIIALKNSLDDIHRFILIDKKGNEEVIHTPGYFLDDEISFNGSWLTWIEQLPHVRWQTQGYSTLIAFNPESRELKRIKTKLRIFAPAMAPSNDLIAASEMNIEGDNFLTFIDITGKVTNRFPSPEGKFLSSPSWSPDGKNIALILTGDQGKEIAVFNLNTQTYTIITPVIIDQISHPVFDRTKIVFNLDINERSEVCSLDPNTGNIVRLTVSKYGTKHPSPSVQYLNSNNSEKRHSLIFSTYTADGYRIAEIKEAQYSNESIYVSSDNTPLTNNQWPLATALGVQEATLARTTEPDDSLHISSYPKAAHLFNFHSWAPVYINIDDQTVNPGFSLMSQNLLSTLFITTGYDWDMTEETGRWKADISWRGWFPEITTGISYGKRAYIPDEDEDRERFTWQETSWDITIDQWLRTLSGKYSLGSLFQLRHQLSINRHNLSTPDDFRSGTIGAINYRFYTYALSKRAYRDLASPFGITLDFHYKNTPYGDFRAGDLFSAQSRIYLPGFLKNHSFQLYGAYQRIATSSEGYRFSADIGLPAGFDGPTPDKLLRFRPSYSLPLLYPDRNAGTAFYLKRIRSSLFLDLAETEENHTNHSYIAPGVDLLADFHLLSLPAPITSGIRISWPDGQDVYISFILSWDFTQY